MYPHRPTFGKYDFPLIACVPIFAGRELPDSYLILCQTRPDSHDSGPEFIVSTCDGLDAPTWHQGTYFRSLEKALVSFYRRSGIADLVDVIS